MEHLIKKIADIAKEKNCSIFLGILPDGRLMIFIEGDLRIINADWSDDVSRHSFIGQVTVLLVFTIISPIVFMLTFCKILKDMLR